MATRKKTAPRKTTKKGASKKATSKKAASKKSASKKAAPKKAAKKKAATKKTPTKKKASKKTTAKKKAATKKTPTKKKASKKTTSKNEAPTSRRRRRQTVVEAVVAADADKDGYVIVNGRRIRRISVDVSLTTKRRAAKAKADAAPVDTGKKIKSPLSRKELTTFKNLLIAKRREVMQALDSMETQALRSDSGDTSSMPIHMADVGSDVYDQDLKLGLSASERERVMDIDAALQRIADCTYGICESTGKIIKMARLNAKPWARFSIDAARKLEPRRHR